MSVELPKENDVIAGRYRIERRLGEGGMAIVYAAHHELLDKRIAIKVLSPNLPRTAALVQRFLTEARAAARVDSVHVARVMEVGMLDSGLPFMVMERLDGCDLEELLALEKKLPLSDAVDYVLQALAGLAHAHRLGVVHRDLKPGNLFLAHQPDGSTVVKILDFGIAKFTSGREAGKLTGGGPMGSPMYMAPEQVRGGTIDHRVDVWAMGVVLYELLVGKTPFEADGVGEMLAAVLEREPEPVRSVRPDLPEEIDRAIKKALAKSPDERFVDVAQLARAIAPFASARWAHLPDTIESTLRKQVSVQSRGEVVPLGRATDVTHTLEEVPAPAKRSRARKIVGIAAALALMGGLGVGWKKHAFDGILLRTHGHAPPQPEVVAAQPPPQGKTPMLAPASIVAPPAQTTAIELSDAPSSPRPRPSARTLPRAAPASSTRTAPSTAHVAAPAPSPSPTTTASTKKRPAILDSAD
jgi:serine/threonine-protein kinase